MGKVIIKYDTLILDYYGALRGQVFSDSIFTNPKDKARTKLNYLNDLCFIRCEYFNE